MLTVLPHAEALRLVQRLAGARGIAWPADPGAVTGVGGFQAPLTHRPGPDAVVWATVHQHNGLLGLFSDRKLVAPLSLPQVTRVQALPLPGLPHLALMVDDRDGRRRLYVWDGHGLRQIFRGEADASLHADMLLRYDWNPRLLRFDAM
jgi:hypothetical protein